MQRAGEAGDPVGGLGDSPFATAHERARRPVDGPDGVTTSPPRSRATEGDPFCHPETETPADTFGRVRGTRVISGANAALADAHHAVLVFDTHDPLAFDEETVVDLLRSGSEWAERARVRTPRR